MDKIFFNNNERRDFNVLKPLSNIIQVLGPRAVVFKGAWIAVRNNYSPKRGVFRQTGLHKGLVRMVVEVVVGSSSNGHDCF